MWHTNEMKIQPKSLNEFIFQLTVKFSAAVKNNE